MTLGDLARDCLGHLVRVRGYSSHTEDAYRRTYDQFRAYLREQGGADVPREFTTARVMGFAEDLAARGCTPNTIVGKLAALSTLASYAMKREERHVPVMKTNPTKGFDWPEMQSAETEFLFPEELTAFLAVPLPLNEVAARDLLVDTGLRASEACRADVGDLRELGDVWVVAVAVKGRGTRRRKIHAPLSQGTVDALRDTLTARKFPPPDSPLLVTRTGVRYTRAALYGLVRRIGEAAGIVRFRVGPHTLRHTCNVIRRVGSIDAHTRSRLLGQSDPKSQSRYDHVVPGELRAAKAAQQEGLARYLNRPTEDAS